MRIRPLRPPRQIIATDPEWEACKSARRALEHHEAIQESASLERSFRRQWSHEVPANPVELNQVLKVLTQKKVPFVLTGAHAIGGWTGRPRATQDVDILVKAGRNHARAVKVLRELYPQLEVRRFPWLTAFFIPGERESVIDVVYPHRADNAETLAHPVWVEDKAAGLRYRIPSLEAALANKYGAMLTATRNVLKRQQDVVDFGHMVKHSEDPGRRPIDLEKLAALGELVWPGGGGEEILRYVAEAKAGQPLSLDFTDKSRGG
jgi:hypothetical protein